VVTSNN